MTYENSHNHCFNTPEHKNHLKCCLCSKDNPKRAESPVECDGLDHLAQKCRLVKGHQGTCWGGLFADERTPTQKSENWEKEWNDPATLTHDEIRTLLQAQRTSLVEAVEDMRKGINPDVNGEGWAYHKALSDVLKLITSK